MKDRSKTTAKKKKPIPIKRRKGLLGKSLLKEPIAIYGGPGGEVVLYRTKDGTIALDVRLDQESIWLNLNQISILFDRDKSVISRHLNNIFKYNELDRNSTVAFFATVQNESGRTVSRQVEYFNLDAILSVGYRVNSKRGTQFRIWATQVLRDHILKGYSVNIRKLEELKQTVRLIAQTSDRPDLTSDEASALLKVIRDYSFAFDLLDDYDHQRLPSFAGGAVVVHPLSYEEAMRFVGRLRAHFTAGDLFGLEKDDGLKGALAAVMQTVDGRDAYPSLEEKAAHLLYFVTKDHAFIDGNKRIAASLFLWFLEKNGALYSPEGEKCFSETALVALTLMIAESRPADKDIIVRIIVRLLQGRPDQAK
jgi:prophage maintenance system killer protein